MGTVDPVTTVIIPLSDRLGRPKKPESLDLKAAKYKAKYASALEEVKKFREPVGELKERQTRTEKKGVLDV